MKNLRMRSLFRRRGVNLKLKKMKLTLLFSFLIFSSVWAESYSQTVSLNLRNVPVKKFMQEVEEQTGYFFLYQDEVIEKGSRISLRVENEPLENVLKKFEEQFGVVAEIAENQIVLKRAPLPLVLNAQQPERSINGFVTDEDGQPLPGVTIVVKGTTTGTITNADGEFSLTIPDDTEILLFS